MVADEVRRLAERSKGSAGDISLIVDSAREETNVTVMAMEKRARQMQAGIHVRPERLLTDAGYASEENFVGLTNDDPDCDIATQSMRNNPTPRSGQRGPLRRDASLVERMDRKVSRKAGRAIYRRRQTIIEPVFGQIKDIRGIRRFMCSGKAAADSEWKLIAGTHNLLELSRRVLTDPTIAPYSRIAAGMAS